MMSPLASTARTDRPHVVIIGAGVIGLAVARELCCGEYRVTLVDRGQPGAEASNAAAGMIAPEMEFQPGTQLWDWGIASKALYPQFISELETETTLEIDLRLGGLIVPSFAGENDSPHAAGGAVSLCRAEALQLEPSLAPTLERAVLYPDAGSVDNRALVRALCAALKIRRVPLHTGISVDEVLTSGGRVCGVRTGTGTLPADVVVNCAGAWADQVRTEGVHLGVKPVKGHMLAVDAAHLEDRDRPRRVLYRHTTYVVPRSDGRVIVGTTIEDRGFDKTVDSSAVNGLVEKARTVWPAVDKARAIDAWTGLRPLAPQCEPRIEATGPEGHFVAVGHYRNGILLTPLTARMVARQVAGRSAALRSS